MRRDQHIITADFGWTTMYTSRGTATQRLVYIAVWPKSDELYWMNDFGQTALYTSQLVAVQQLVWMSPKCTFTPYALGILVQHKDKEK